MPNKVSVLNQTHPTECPTLLRVRQDYAAWNWTYHKGYIRYNLCGSLFYEHQLVVAYGYHNGPSTREIHAHHDNENKLENRLDNLIYLPNGDHQKLHDKNANTVTCDSCGKPVKRRPARVQKRQYNFCNRQCYLTNASAVNKAKSG